jgi:hypothetical protein
LVFSKTSLQADKISPRQPRAIYFNDDAAIGFVKNGRLELAGLDPKQGMIFYTMSGEKTEPPRLVRSQGCLRCHQGPATAGVPGLFVSSVFPNASGMASRLRGIVTDHRTPFAQRWGGWYVTGTHGRQRHRGNAVALNPAQPEELETEGTQNLTSLDSKFVPAGYLSPLSDIVALMTLEHQTQMINLLTRVGWEARIAAQPSNAGIEEIVAYMLFADEDPLRDPIQGVSTFSKTFPQRGPRDGRGRSLRDFDLQTRLFRYPLSYMIYARAFDALPDAVRERIYLRLFEILSGQDPSEKFARLSAGDRQSILEILRETKSNLPAYWRAHPPPGR